MLCVIVIFSVIFHFFREKMDMFFEVVNTVFLTYDGLRDAQNALFIRDVRRFIDTHPATRDYGVVVLKQRHLSRLSRLRTCIILKEGPRPGSLGHFVLLYVDRGQEPECPTIYFMDSMSEGMNGHILKYIIRHSTWSDIVTNRVLFQEPGTVTCGYWCLFILIKFIRGVRFDLIQSIYGFSRIHGYGDLDMIQDLRI